jgi:hypothetical protein
LRGRRQFPSPALPEKASRGAGYDWRTGQAYE